MPRDTIRGDEAAARQGKAMRCDAMDGFGNDMSRLPAAAATLMRTCPVILCLTHSPPKASVFLVGVTQRLLLTTQRVYH
jgi:hypothetical protein